MVSEPGQFGVLKLQRYTGPMQESVSGFPLIDAGIYRANHTSAEGSIGSSSGIVVVQFYYHRRFLIWLGTKTH